MRRHPRIITAMIALLGVVAAGCGGERSGEVIARVNQRPITQHQLWDYLEKEDDGLAGRRALDALVMHQLMRQEAEKRDIEVTREEIDTRLAGLKDYVLASSGKEFEAWLDETGQSEQDLVNRVSLQILTGKLVLTPEDREKFFETHKARLTELPHNNKSVIYRLIIVTSREEADAIYTELTREGGADFATVAEEKSLEMGSRARGGMAGWVIEGKSGDPELEQALFALDPGKVSEPLAFQPPALQGTSEEAIERPTYWRIVKVEKRILPPSEITLEANASVIEDWMLKDPQFQMQLGQFFGSLRARGDVEILSPRYETVGKVYQREREARERRQASPTGAAPLPPGRRGGRAPAPRAGGAEPGAVGD